MTSTTAILDWLNESQIKYFVPWGYEYLPQAHTGGDMDICVHPQDFEKVAEELVLRKYQTAKCPQYSNFHKHAHFAHQSECTIDLFTTFCFAYEGKTVVLNIDYDGFRRFARVDGLWIATPATEALFTALRVIGGRKDCVKRLEKYFA